MTVLTVPQLSLSPWSLRAGALDRDKQIAVVGKITELVSTAAGDPGLAKRTWVLLTEAPEGGWGL